MYMYTCIYITISYKTSGLLHVGRVIISEKHNAHTLAFPRANKIEVRLYREHG